MNKGVKAGLAGVLAFEAAMLMPSGADAMTVPEGNTGNVCTTRIYDERPDGGLDLRVRVPMGADLSEGLGYTVTPDEYEYAEFALVMDGLTPLAWGRVRYGEVDMPAGEGVVTLIAASDNSTCSAQIML